MATREKRKEIIDQLCEEHGCSEKVKKIHFDQFVNHNWHPHPPEAFEKWWKYQKPCTDDGIEARRAWNCQCYRDEYLEHKGVGLA